MKLPSRLKMALLSTLVVSGFVVVLNAADKGPVTTGEADREMALQAKTVRHAMPAKTEQGNSLRSTEIRDKFSANSNSSGAERDRDGTRYPGDLQYHGGAVLESIESHAIFVNPSPPGCPANTCWGDPEGFLKDIGRSDFIHIVDQYIGLHSGDRYSLGSSATVNYPASSSPYTDNDILAIVHAVASASGQSGYGHMYQVFLTPGTDECFDSTYTVCYSPDNYPTFYFCAYHGSADFPDIGHVIYSVEPFQNVGGCSVRPGTPNGSLIDSTNNVLSHELIEAITDPDGNAYWNSADNGLYGQEIGDECSFVTAVPPPGGFDPSVVRLGEHHYAIQPEYSNSRHGCAIRP